VLYEVDVMTDGLTEVNCKPLQSEGVEADPDWVSYVISKNLAKCENISKL